MASYYWVRLGIERYKKTKTGTYSQVKPGTGAVTAEIGGDRLQAPDELGLIPQANDVELGDEAEEYTSWAKLRRSIYLLPNSVIVVLTDLFTFYALRFVSASTYALFLQSQMIFIVGIRYCVLRKKVDSQSLVAIMQLALGVSMFQLAKIQEQSTVFEIFGIALTVVRASMKAADIVFVEWFLHAERLKDLTFYEKQSFVGMWFIVMSIVVVIIKDGADIFIHGRSLFDGWDWVTVMYVVYSAVFSVAIYIVLKKMDGVQMGLIALLTVPTTVLFDVWFFGTKMNVLMALCIGVVITSLLQYKLTEANFAKLRRERELFVRPAAIDLGRIESNRSVEEKEDETWQDL